MQRKPKPQKIEIPERWDDNVLIEPWVAYHARKRQERGLAK